MGFFGDVVDGAAGAVASPLGLAGSLLMGGSGSGLPTGLNRKKEENPLIRKYQTFVDDQSNYKPQALQKENVGDVATKYQAPLAEYQQARDQIKNDVNTQFSQRNQESQDALQRAQARAGGVGGAFIRQGEIIRDKLNQQKDEALKSQLSPLDLQEAQTKRALTAQGEDAINARNMQRDLYNSDQEFKGRVFQADQYSKLAQLDLAWQNFEEEQASNDANIAMNAYTARHSGGLLGAGGILGTGIGA